MTTTQGRGVMTNNRPLWLLDFDGVINVNPGKPDWGAAPRRTQVLADGVFWKLRWAPALIERIWALHRSGLVEIRWATSWIGNTDKVEAALRLPHFDASYEDPAPGVAYTDAHPRLKLGAALDAIEAGRPLIWTDDDAIPHYMLTDVDWEALDVLLIAPQPNRGLLPEHVDAIEAFIERPRCESQGCHCLPSLPCESACDGQQYDDGSSVACTMCVRERAEMME